MEQELKDKLEVFEYIKKYIEHTCIFKDTDTLLPSLFKDIMEFVMRSTKGNMNPSLVADVIKFIGIEKDKEYIVIDNTIHLYIFKEKKEMKFLFKDNPSLEFHTVWDYFRSENNKLYMLVNRIVKTIDNKEYIIGYIGEERKEMEQ